MKKIENFTLLSFAEATSDECCSSKNKKKVSFPFFLKGKQIIEEKKLKRLKRSESNPESNRLKLFLRSGTPSFTLKRMLPGKLWFNKFFIVVNPRLPEKIKRNLSKIIETID